MDLDGTLLRIKNACQTAQRPLDSVRLIAVSKGQSVEKIRALNKQGFSDFGENYLAELEEKASELSSENINWIFIGRLQSNKIQRIVKIASEIQSIESLKHARYIARYAKAFDKTPYPVYIEVNAFSETQKGGVHPSAVSELSQQIADTLPELKLMGIMVVPPKKEEGQKKEEMLYLQLKKTASQTGQGKLSLGMSDDLEKAIIAGSTTVRIGRALFGERKI